MIISEIGQNWLGMMPLAEKMIISSMINGATACKFQLFDTDKLYKPDTELYQLAKEAELDFDKAYHLFCFGREVGIDIFFSVFDTERVKWCKDIGVNQYKIAKRSNIDKELIDACLNTGKPIILSSHRVLEGMPDNVFQLYCVGNYPTDLGEHQFGEIEFGEYAFDGFSDHSEGLDACMIAIARGANIIEKHFVLDEYSQGVDRKWSMTAMELSALNDFYHKVQEAL